MASAVFSDYEFMTTTRHHPNKYKKTSQNIDTDISYN